MVKVTLADIGGEICLCAIASLFLEAGDLAIHFPRFKKVAEFAS